MKTKFESIKNEFLTDFETISNSKEFEALRIKYLGKKGIIQGLYGMMRESAPADKPKLGTIPPKELERSWILAYPVVNRQLAESIR
jgi:phenylalanyl-tRNA synthetase alpha chain